MKNASESFDEKDYVCLKKSFMQEKLYLGSLFYILIGSCLAALDLFINCLAIAFLCTNKKARRSPVCIYLLFLSISSNLQILEFVLIAVGKSDLIQTMSSYFCNLINFLRNFSSHMGIYMIILLQTQRFIAIKKNTHFNLLLYNHALTYLICIALVFVFFIIDEFYLYENFFLNGPLYCPLTLMFTCITNNKFKLLNSIKFDILIYHHFNTVIYNILPFALILVINTATACEIFQRNSRLNEARHLGDSDTRKCRVRLTSTSSITPGKRVKPKILNVRLNGLFLSLNDITYMSLVVSTLTIIFTFPNNLFSYLAEWNSEILEKINLIREETVLHGRTAVQGIPQVPNRLIGETNVEIQFFFQLFFMLTGLIDVFNFSFFLIFQFFSCSSLSKEFRSFVRQILVKLGVCRVSQSMR